MKVTKQDLAGALATLVREAPELAGAHLECWAPGDGLARYRVMIDGREPLGSSYWLGKQEAYHGLWTAIYALRLRPALAALPAARGDA